MTADHAVAGIELVFHPEVAAAMRNELVDLLERARIEKQLHALAGCELSLRVLLLGSFLPTALFRAAVQICQVHGRWRQYITSGSFRRVPKRRPLDLARRGLRQL